MCEFRRATRVWGNVKVEDTGRGICGNELWGRISFGKWGRRGAKKGKFIRIHLP